MIGSLDNSWAVMTTRSIKFPAPGVKVYQHSAGRQHLIVLSERGEVWYVSGANSEVPVLCSFAELDIVLGYPGDTQRRPGTVSKVVAGWNVSGALVEGYGIAVWFGTQPGDGGQFHVKDAPFLSRLNAMEDADAVVDFAIGENYLMAVTASGKVYAANIEDIEQEELIAPMEMLNFEAPAGHPPINRVVGWFRKFALFNKDGLVHIVDDSKDLKVSRQLLYGDDASHGLSGALEEMRTDAVTPTEVPGLKEYTIVDVAFGDWHCLALTDTGKVLSWGRESGLCGCLGLGRPDVAEQKGLRINNGYDGDLDTAQVVTFEHPYSENEEQGDGMLHIPPLISIRILTHSGTTEYAYKIAAAGWHSCALVAMVEKGSTLSAGGISKPLALDGSGDSKPPDETPKPPGPKSPQPPTEKGHRGGIEGVPSDARGGRVSLAEASIARAGGNSIFGLGTSAKQIPPPPPTEHGHRGGIVGVQSDARGGNSSLAEGSMARGGQSFFGMTGGALQLGEGDRLSESRETEKEKAKKRKLEQ